MSPLYNFSISVTLFALKIISPFSRKVKIWLEGRKNWREKLLDSHIGQGKYVVWFHCASLGEFEQAKPVIQELKKEYSCVSILVTFFSPSGYEARKNTDLADYVGYLPADTLENANDFLTLANPKLVFFVKSEIWPNFITALARKHVPMLLISARFYEGQKLLKSALLKRKLKKFAFIFVQDKLSQKLLQEHYIESVLASDTRFDQVLQLLETPKIYPVIEAFKGDSPLLVVGSCWHQDIEVLLPFVNEAQNEVKIILAPHDIGEKMIQEITSKLTVPFVRYSQVNEKQDFGTKKVIIIDNIGMLAYLYRYASVAYVGGAFKQGLHNILEPAAYGIPVIFGPRTEGFPEAKEMLQQECAFSISNKTELKNLLNNLFQDKTLHEKISESTRLYVERKKGATENIMNHVRTILAARIENQ